MTTLHWTVLAALAHKINISYGIRETRALKVLKKKGYVEYVSAPLVGGWWKITLEGKRAVWGIKWH